MSKPKPLSERVKYWAGGIIGIWNVRPRMYSGLGRGQFDPLFRLADLGHVPEVKVFEALPQELKRDRFAIVHVALAWVFPQDTVHDNLFLAKQTKSPSALSGLVGLMKGCLTALKTTHSCHGTSFLFGMVQPA